MANKKVKFELTAVNKTKAAFNSVTKGLKGVGSGAAKVTKGVAKIGLAAAGAATALAALVKVNIDFMDKLGKTSSKLGIEVEFLQSMRFAAEQTGVKVEALDMGLQRFIRRAAEAARGTGESKRAFEQLGIQLTDTNGNLRPVRDVLFEVADGIQNTTSSAEKVRLAFKFFDSEGVSLVNTLKDGSKGMKEFEQQAENLGIIISSQTIKKAEKFADSLNIVKKQVMAISANIASGFIPILQNMSKKLTDFLVKMKGGDKTFEKFGMGIANSVIEFVAIGIEKLGLFGDALASFVREARIKLIEMENQFLNFVKGVLKELPSKMGDFTEQIDNLSFATIRNNKAILDLSNQTSGYGDKAKKTANTLRLYKNDLENIKDTNNGLNDSFVKTGEALGDIGSPLAVYKEQLNKVGKTMEQVGVKSMKTFEDAIINGLKTGKLAFKDFASVVVEELIRVAIQQLVIRNLLNLFSFGTAAGSGSGTTKSGGGVNFDGGGYTGMGARAGGVDGKGGFPAILHPNETVIDHEKGQEMGATVNFNISTVDAAGFDQLLASRKGLITQIINNAMNTQGKVGVA